MQTQASSVDYARQLAHKLKSIILWDKLLSLVALLLIIETVLYPQSVSRWRSSIDWTSITVITGLVIGSSLLESSGALHQLMLRLQSKVGPRHVYPVIIAGSGLIAGIVLNDAAVFVSVPAVLALSPRDPETRAKLLVLVLAAINVGSAITPFGNPQDVIITHYYDLSLACYLKYSIPVYLPLLSIIALYSAKITPSTKTTATIKVSRPVAVLGALTIVAAIISSLSRQPLLLVPLLIPSIILGHGSLSAKDLTIIPVLAGIFALLAPLNYTLPGSSNPIGVYIQGFALSLIISNVPATIALLGSPWKPLHVAVNLAGTAHPYSSLANLIGLRLAGVNWLEYMRKNILLAIIIFCYGLIILYVQII